MRGSAGTSVRGLDSQEGARESLVTFFAFSKGKGLAHKYPTDLNDDNFAAEMQHFPLVYIKQILEYKY